MRNAMMTFPGAACVAPRGVARALQCDSDSLKLRHPLKQSGSSQLFRGPTFLQQSLRDGFSRKATLLIRRVD